jgi:hypothetical protein
MLVAPARLGAEAPLHPVEVSVWSVTGSYKSLSGSMRVDALFFRQGRDGKPLTTHEVLLVLRNVEIAGSSPSADKHKMVPMVTTLLLTSGQSQAVRALPPAVTQLVVIMAPQNSPHSPASSAVSVPPGTARDRSTEPVTAFPKSRDLGPGPVPAGTARHGANTGATSGYASTESQAAAPDQYATPGDSSNTALGGVLRSLLWPTVGFLVLKTFAGTLRGVRRCRRNVTFRRRADGD